MKKLSKVDLLILDEFLLTIISEYERNDLFEEIQSRTDKKTIIYCSQWAPEVWLDKLDNGPLTDAILDRIRNSSYTILLKGRSLREDYSKIK
ncbi:ATP-binding protein [Holdemanella biformis]